MLTDHQYPPTSQRRLELGRRELLGRQPGPRWKQLLGLSIPLRLVREAAEFDIHIVSLEDEAAV